MQMTAKLDFGIWETVFKEFRAQWKNILAQFKLIIWLSQSLEQRMEMVGTPCYGVQNQQQVN